VVLPGAGDPADAYGHGAVCFRRAVHGLDALDIHYTIPIPFAPCRVDLEAICRADDRDDVTLCADCPAISRTSCAALDLPGASPEVAALPARF